MDTIAFNPQEIEISAVYFSKNQQQVRFESYPKRFIYKGREYVLAEA